jgi:hypothetical protein
VSEAVLAGLPLPTAADHPRVPFRPKPPADLAEAGLSPTRLESLILKALLNQGNASGRRVAEELGLPFVLVGDMLRNLTNPRIVAYTDDAAAGDYDYGFPLNSRRPAPHPVRRTRVGRSSSRRHLMHGKMRPIEGIEKTRTDLGLRTGCRGPSRGTT